MTRNLDNTNYGGSTTFDLELSDADYTGNVSRETPQIQANLDDMPIPVSAFTTNANSDLEAPNFVLDFNGFTLTITIEAEFKCASRALMQTKAKAILALINGAQVPFSYDSELFGAILVKIDSIGFAKMQEVFSFKYTMRLIACSSTI